MSKSLTRVRAALNAAGVTVDNRETATARTAADAAASIGCEVDQIAKSIVLKGERSGNVVLFITAGGGRVDLARAAALASEPLGKADAGTVRAQTGFAIGGVSPVGHITATPKWFDRRLLDFDMVWAAAGTPHHVFGLHPANPLQISGAQIVDFKHIIR